MLELEESIIVTFIYSMCVCLFVLFCLDGEEEFALIERLVLGRSNNFNKGNEVRCMEIWNCNHLNRPLHLFYTLVLCFFASCFYLYVFTISALNGDVTMWQVKTKMAVKYLFPYFMYSFILLFLVIPIHIILLYVMNGCILYVILIYFATLNRI